MKYIRKSTVLLAILLLYTLSFVYALRYFFITDKQQISSSLIITSRTIIVPDDYPTIQEAINAAGDEDIIYVRTGTYYENLVVNKTVSLIGEDKFTTIIDGMQKGKVFSVSEVEVKITGFTIRNGSTGIFLHYSVGEIIDNIITGNGVGIEILWTKDNLIANNTFTDNDSYGIHLTGSGRLGWAGASIINNKISRSGVGIYVGIWSEGIIINNTIEDGLGGIYLGGERAIVKNNSILNNKYNFGVLGTSLRQYLNQEIDYSNTINGNPIYYLVNQSNLVIDPSTFPNAGYLGIVNSNNISVRDIHSRNNYQGLLLAFTNNSIVEKVRFSDNRFGLVLSFSNNNTVMNCAFSYNLEGVYLMGSHCNLLTQNEIITNISDPNIENSGLELNWGSKRNVITRNSIIGYYIGVQSGINDHNNSFFHNNFINTKQVSNVNSINIWDDGYPSGGNYWSDYNGTDLYSGPYQNMTGSDGVGDIPYVIDERNVDRYPLMAPWTSSINATVDIISDALNLLSKVGDTMFIIELSERYDVDDIVVSSILLNDTISVDSAAPFVVGDYDEDSVPDLMVRFNGTILSEFILSAGIVYGNVTLTLTGKLINSVSFQGSDIILVSALVGDVNVDGKVDIIDLSIAALAFGSYPGHPRWDPQADINNDNYIDITDIALTARNLGTTYQ